MRKLYIVDIEVLQLSAMARNILSDQVKLIGQLLKNVDNKKRSDASIVGLNILMAGAESICIEIIEGISKGYIVTPLLSLRTLFEIYINIHYIFYHPKHLSDMKWATKICEDYIKRSCSNDCAKSKLNGVPLSKRAEDVDRDDEYKIIYTTLCNYNHALMQVVNCGNKKELKVIQIKMLIYSITFLQDCLTALCCFFKENNYDKLMTIIDKIQKCKEFSSSIEI